MVMRGAQISWRKWRAIGICVQKQTRVGRNVIVRAVGTVQGCVCVVRTRVVRAWYISLCIILDYNDANVLMCVLKNEGDDAVTHSFICKRHDSRSSL